MGLDISYFENQPESVIETDEDWPSSGSFRAGSYSGYNEWRRMLCIAVLGVQPEEVWANQEKYEGRPFNELICFSDCEGTRNAEVSKKLAKDFEEFRNRACNGQDEYFIEKYNEWAKAFKIASNNGFVVFH